MAQPFQFSWRVPTGGYCWLRGQQLDSHLKPIKKGVFLVPRTAPPGARTWQPEYPLFCDEGTGRGRNTGLFRTFAQTEPNEAAILAFANTYGQLLRRTSPVMVQKPDFPIDTVGAEKDGERVPIYGEDLQFWRDEIGIMRNLVGLWDALCNQDIAALRAAVIWKEEKNEEGNKKRYWVSIRLRDSIDVAGVVAGPDHYPERLEQMQPGDLLTPVSEFLGDRINEQLQKHRACATLAFGPGDGRRQARTKAPLSLRLFLQPENLLGALYLQFAHCIDGRRKYKACDFCGRWCELGVELKAGAKFCGNACKQRDKRKRMAEARELKKKGRSLREIARELKTDVATAKGWVKQ